MRERRLKIEDRNRDSEDLELYIEALTKRPKTLISYKLWPTQQPALGCVISLLYLQLPQGSNSVKI
jgi:hypothetical protein